MEQHLILKEKDILMLKQVRVIIGRNLPWRTNVISFPKLVLTTT